MVTKQCNSGVEIGPRRYTVGKTGSWTLTVFQDGVMECSCPDAQIRRRACKHQQAYAKGEITSKPRVRVTQRLPLPTARRARISDEGREIAAMLDV